MLSRGRNAADWLVKPMEAYSGTRIIRRISSALRWESGIPAAVAVALLIVGLSIGASGAQTSDSGVKAQPPESKSGAKIQPSESKANTKAQPSESNAKPSGSKAHTHVYLLRGAFNIFSLGMDEISARLNRLGISTTVINYLGWESLAEQAAAEYKSGRVRNIIIVGHSSGATAVTEMAARLGQLGVPVKLAIGLDPTSHLVATGRVERYINYYVANGVGSVVDRSRELNGTVENVDLEKNPNIGHFNIDKNRALQDKIIADIRAAAP